MSRNAFSNISILENDVIQWNLKNANKMKTLINFMVSICRLLTEHSIHLSSKKSIHQLNYYYSGYSMFNKIPSLDIIETRYNDCYIYISIYIYILFRSQITHLNNSKSSFRFGFTHHKTPSKRTWNRELQQNSPTRLDFMALIQGIWWTQLVDQISRRFLLSFSHNCKNLFASSLRHWDYVGMFWYS